MAFANGLRQKLRRGVDGLFCSSSPDVRRVGDTDSGWVIHTNPMPEICCCAGVGKGMSFELELARILSQTARRPVVVFDPSPTGIATVERSDTANLRFFPVGLAAQSGRVEFSLPQDPGEGSYSVARIGSRKVAFECWDLPTIMAQNGDSAIDLLKMDIEGFEFDILARLLDERTPVRQICVEFHPWLGRGRTLRTILRLHRVGYCIVHKHRGDYTFVLKEAAWRKLVEHRIARSG